MEIFSFETAYKLNSLCVYFLFYVVNSIFLGRFVADILWRKYILDVEGLLSNYNKYIYIPLFLIASFAMISFLMAGYNSKPFNSYLQISWLSATIQFVLYLSIPIGITLIIIKLKETLILSPYYKLNLEVKILKGLIYGLIVFTIFIYSGPIIFNIAKSGLDSFIDIPIIILATLPAIEMIYSLIRFLKKSITVKNIITFKQEKMESINRQVREVKRKKSYLNSFASFVDIRSYLVIKHKWDLIFTNPTDDIIVTAYFKWYSLGGHIDEPTFEVHPNIKKLLPKFTKLPSTVVSKVLKENTVICFSKHYIRDDSKYKFKDMISFRPNPFYKFTVDNLNKKYVVTRLDKEEFEIQLVIEDYQSNFRLDKNSERYTLSYDILKIPDYVQISLKGLSE